MPTKDENSGIALVYSYQYQEGVDKPRADGWEMMKAICIAGSLDFWGKKDEVEKNHFRHHLDRFKNEQSYACSHFAGHAGLFESFCDQNGLLQRDKIADFAATKWGFGLYDSGFRWWLENNYYGACNAYDSRYEGVSCQDFVECNFLFDWEAIQ